MWDIVWVSPQGHMGLEWRNDPRRISDDDDDDEILTDDFCPWSLVSDAINFCHYLSLTLNSINSQSLSKSILHITVIISRKWLKPESTDHIKKTMVSGNLESMTQDTERRSRTTATQCVHLRRVLVSKVSNLTHNHHNRLISNAANTTDSNKLRPKNDFRYCQL